jgi:hypothetical protein
MECIKVEGACTKNILKFETKTPMIKRTIDKKSISAMFWTYQELGSISDAMKTIINTLQNGL